MKDVMKAGLWLFLFGWMPSCGNSPVIDTSSAELEVKPIPNIAGMIIQFSDVGETSVALSWPAALDVTGKFGPLTYLPYYTAQVPDSGVSLTPERVVAHWTPIGAATVGLTTATATGLSPDTTYYFTVLVSNKPGGRNIYYVEHQKTLALSASSTDSGVGPTVTVGIPSATAITSSGTSTIAFTYVDSAAGETALTGTLTEAGGGITTTVLTGNPSCTVTVSQITVAGGSILLSNCTGTGTLMVHVNAGTAEDATQHASLVSPESDIILVDNTAPTIVRLTPAASTVRPLPTAIIASFSKAISPISASAFILGITGGCITVPTKGTVQMSEDKMVAILPLSGGYCYDTGALTVSLDPATSSDLLGNVGSGAASTATYTYSLVGPSASLGVPSLTLLDSTAASTIALTYSGGTTLTGALTAGGGGITVTQLSGNPSCTVAVSSITISGASIALSGCTGNGTLVVHADAGVITDVSNHMSIVSPESTVITVSNAPAVSSTTPSTGTAILAIPSRIIVNFSKAVTATSGNFSLSTSTCSSVPTISSIAGSGTSSITVHISGGTCVGSQSLVMVTTLSDIVDLSGNAGSGTNTITLPYAKRIFFSNATHTGNFATGFSDWRAGVDDFCMHDSSKPSTGTYKALMTDGSTRVACTTAFCSGGTSEHVDWVLSPSTAYVRPDATLVGTTTSAGVFGSAPHYTLNGSIWTVSFSADSHVWTGMDMDQRNWIHRNGATCSAWTSASSGASGGYGTDSDANDNAFNYYTDGCNMTNHLYCVEQ